MFRIQLFAVVCVLVLVCAATPAPAASGPHASLSRIPVDSVSARAVPVAAWDQRSPQRLFRIEGSLYQKETGFYYRVEDDRVTVRLAPDVRSWDELIARAEPGVRSALGSLVALRTNSLGIVDLEIPDTDPAYWSELIFSTGLVRYAEVSAVGEWLATPTDPLYSQQWALNNTGQTGGTAGADMKAEAAWELSTGTPDVIVAILDSGTDIDHVDLSSNIWHNSGDTPGNGQDDDGNGYVDDFDGWDFENNNNNPRGTNFHGTHVAGTIIAAGNNGNGVVGLAGGLGSAGVRGMIAQVGNNGPVGSVIDDAILYAANNGAQIITMSLTVPETTAINDALDYAYNTKDVFIDCAAGNNGGSVTYPARRAEVMAVASTDHNDNRSGFSNPGSQLEVAAPGTNIYSTQIGNTYGQSSGTSFAAPYVAALAGLIRGVSPGLPAPDVRQLIIDTSDDVESPGFDTLTGHGRINAFQALLQLGSSDGSIDLDAEIYACTGQLEVTVEDFDLVSLGPIIVTASSGEESGGEDVQLDEITPGVFKGVMDLGVGAALPDGVLQVHHADLVSVEYIDADDGEGGLFVSKVDTATTDCVGPAITNVGSTNIDDTNASIVWNTDEPALSLVRYGTGEPLDQEEASLFVTTSHVLAISGLESCSNYLFEVESTDGLGNVAVDDNGGFYHTFQTLGDFPGVGLSACQLGQPRLDANQYGCTDTVEVSVTDLDLNEDPGAVETVKVQMTSTTEPEGEWITLTEDDLSSIRFAGTIELNGSASSGDGMLGASPGDLITVTYQDEDDGEGQSRISIFTSVADCVGPTIADLRVTAISATRAEIEWTTDEPSTSRVEFGPTAALGSVAEDTELTTSHRVVVSAFDTCERVHFTVTSTDERGASSSAGGGGSPFEFNLNRIGGALFHDNFETDSGWNLEGEWERAAPQALGSSIGDPDKAYSGSVALGTDLSGDGFYPGDYESNTSESATSPSFDTSGVASPELILRRKLGVNAGDTARILLETLPFQLIWTSSDALEDQDWVERRYDLSAVGDRTSVRFSFGINSAFGSHSYGWNIDEVIVKDSTQPDYLACADCSGAPSFGGLAAVYDPDPCGASGLALEWKSAPAFGTGSGATYEVHRGLTSNFVPDETNLIASGLTGTSWNDAAAPVDTPVWYVVRVRNDESCDGGEGLSDGNTVRRSATETLAQSAPASVGESVRVTEVGQAHVRVSWDPVDGATGYVVRRSEETDFQAADDLGSTALTFYDDANAAPDGKLYLYRVFAVNACGHETP